MKRSILFSSIVLIITLSIYSFTLIKTNKAMTTDGTKKVCISTSYGDIKIKLYNETPKHRDNFIKLAKEAYFDGTLFHRVIKDFMIQGGDPTSKNADSTAILGNGGPSYTIPAEIIFDSITAGTKKLPVAKFFHKKGALGAARDNNPAKASSGSQFYIVQGRTFSEAELNVFCQKSGKTLTKEQINTYETTGGSPWLDGDYTVFGEVYEGLAVVDKIASVKIGANDRPVKDIKMTVKVIE
jgi:peptidyl-prolyl cis-trans isomerase B (cyclophilin B)